MSILCSDCVLTIAEFVGKDLEILSNMAFVACSWENGIKNYLIYNQYEKNFIFNSTVKEIRLCSLLAYSKEIIIPKKLVKYHTDFDNRKIGFEKWGNLIIPVFGRYSINILIKVELYKFGRNLKIFIRNYSCLKGTYYYNIFISKRYASYKIKSNLIAKPIFCISYNEFITTNIYQDILSCINYSPVALVDIFEFFNEF